MVNAAYDGALTLKRAGVLPPIVSPDSNMFSSMQSKAGDRQRYLLFRGWLYSAVHALALEASGQPVNVGRLSAVVQDGEGKRALATRKALALKGMGGRMRAKALANEVEIVEDDPLLGTLHQPNPFQYNMQFVYSFVANLNLTGWAYVVGGKSDEGGLEFWSLPTTWVHPNKDFTEFKIVNPRNPSSAGNAKPLTRENVAWAYIPDPSDPLSAYAPASSQMQAIRTDDHIQESQQKFFENGIFPSAVLTIGENPLGDGTPRKVISGVQRRQILLAINAVNASVANYGAPLILDGMISKFERFSATQNEMGWEKSEPAARTRILSAFAVHPFILGEVARVGGYAQTYSITERFCKRVNVFLEMLDVVMTCFAEGFAEGEQKPVVWWDKCEPQDPSLRHKALIEARKSNDISRNEFRAELGFAAVEENEERSKLMDTAAGMTGAKAILDMVASGAITLDVAANLLSEFFQIPIERMREIVDVNGEQQVLEEPVEMLREGLAELRVQPKLLGVELAESVAVGVGD